MSVKVVKSNHIGDCPTGAEEGFSDINQGTINRALFGCKNGVLGTFFGEPLA